MRRFFDRVFSQLGADSDWDSERYGPAVPDNPTFSQRMADKVLGTSESPLDEGGAEDTDVTSP